MMKRFFLIGVLWLGAWAPLHAAKRPATNEIAVEIPLDGGGMLMVSRQWAFGKYIRAGFFVGGGVIQRDFDLEVVGLSQDVEAETDALILPMIGPRVTFQFPIVGLSLGWGVYYAKTDFDVESSILGNLSGDESGLGTGFYSPLLALDFYLKQWDLVLGAGLGGFLGTSYPDLVATSPNVRLTTNENPIDTLTLHLRALWRVGHRRPVEEDDDF